MHQVTFTFKSITFADHVIEDEPPKKRRRTRTQAETPTPEAEHSIHGGDYQQDLDMNMNMDMDFGNDYGAPCLLENESSLRMLRRKRCDGVRKTTFIRGGASLFQLYVAETLTPYTQEPGQGRNASRPPSMIGSHLDFRLRGAEDSAVGSQKSALFPWDNAGVSSSSGLGFDFAEGTPARSADVRIRQRNSQAQSPSLRERGSSVLRSLAASPALFAPRNSRLSVDEFEFECE